MRFFQFKTKIVPSVSVCLWQQIWDSSAFKHRRWRGGGENPQILHFLFVVSLCTGKSGLGMSRGREMSGLSSELPQIPAWLRIPQSSQKIFWKILCSPGIIFTIYPTKASPFHCEMWLRMKWDSEFLERGLPWPFLQLEPSTSLTLVNSWCFYCS